MRTRMLSLLFSVAVTTNASALEAGDDESITRTREYLRRQLEAARATGVVAVRGEHEATPGALRDGDASLGASSYTGASTRCITHESLSATAAQLRGDPVTTLEAFRNAVLDGEAAARREAELALAKSYLVLGFAEEARAISAPRDGAEAAGVAGLALLAEGRPADAARKIEGLGACGAVYGFISEAAAVLMGARVKLSPSSREALANLPEPLSRPIAEAIAVQAIEAGGDPAETLRRIPLSSSSVGRSEARAFIDAMSLSDETSSAAQLAVIGAAPGPFRAQALETLSTRIGSGVPAEIEGALEDDAMEEIETGKNIGPIARLSLSLAEIRLRKHDFAGTARALFAAYQYESTRDTAKRRFRQIFAPLVQSEDFGDRLPALAVITAYSDLAADSLASEDIKIAASKAAALGAVDSATKILNASSIAPFEAGLMMGEAAYRAGDFEKASSILEPLAADKRALDLLRRLAIQSGDREAEERYSASIGKSAVGDFLWRRGRYAALAEMADADSDEEAEVEKVLLSHIATRRSAPSRLLRSSKGEQLGPLFASAPDPTKPDAAAAVAEFVRLGALSITYLKQANTRE
jgi:hypothetical protein